MELLQRLAHARALDRLQSTALGEPVGSTRPVAAPRPTLPSTRTLGTKSEPFVRREVVIPLALAPVNAGPRAFAERVATGRPAMLGGCLDRLELPTSLALARDLVCLGAARGVRPVFIDTETTGLGGVAVPFMVGIAWYAHDHLTVTQWTLARLGGEAQMLADVLATLRTLGPDPLVSFNGASFDLPLLRVRARRHGLCDQVLAAAPVGQLDHVDLLHPARRVHNGFGADCRLSTLERDLLGLRRRGDIESAEIPAVFWMALEAPEDPQAQRRLQAVCEHNVVDLASLPALAARIAQTIREPQDLERGRRAARHFLKLGAHEQARVSLARWVEPGLARARDGQVLAQGWREAALELADLERRVGTRERAAVLWHAAWLQQPGCPLASDAWAKHLEHHVHDFAEALRVARASRLACERRITRLEHKLARAQVPAAVDPTPEPVLAVTPVFVVPAPAAHARVAPPALPRADDPLPAPSPRASLDLRQRPRSELLSVVEDESGARRRYRLLR